eukprot:Rmarinus@m.909
MDILELGATTCSKEQVHRPSRHPTKMLMRRVLLFNLRDSLTTDIIRMPTLSMPLKGSQDMIPFPLVTATTGTRTMIALTALTRITHAISSVVSGMCTITPHIRSIVCTTTVTFDVPAFSRSGYG